MLRFVLKSRAGSELASLPKSDPRTLHFSHYFDERGKMLPKSERGNHRELTFHAKRLAQLVGLVIFRGHLTHLTRSIHFLNTVMPLSQMNFAAAGETVGVRVERDRLYVYVSNELRRVPMLKNLSYRSNERLKPGLSYSLIVDHLLSFNRELVNQNDAEMSNRMQYLDMLYLQLLYIKYFDTMDVACQQDLKRVLTGFGEKRGEELMYGLKKSEWVSLFLSRRLRFVEST